MSITFSINCNGPFFEIGIFIVGCHIQTCHYIIPIFEALQISKCCIKSKIIAYSFKSKRHYRRIIISIFNTRRNKTSTIPVSLDICSIERRRTVITHVVKIGSIIINEDVLSTIYKLACIGNVDVVLQGPHARTYRYFRFCFGHVVILISCKGSLDGVRTIRFASGKQACFAINGEVASSGFYRISDFTRSNSTSIRYSQRGCCIERFEQVDACRRGHAQRYVLLCGYGCGLVGNSHTFYSNISSCSFKSNRGRRTCPCSV